MEMSSNKLSNRSMQVFNIIVMISDDIGRMKRYNGKIPAKTEKEALYILASDNSFEIDDVIDYVVIEGD